MPSAALSRAHALLLASCCLLVAYTSEADSPKLPAAEIAVSAGMLSRHAKSGTSDNPGAIGYKTALGFEVDAHVAITNWLRITPYYLRSSHTIDAPSGSLAPASSQIDVPSLFAFSLGARIEPTWLINERARAWVSFGYGWGRTTMGKMKVQGDYTVPERDGVFLEMPVGIGAAYDVWKNHLAVDLQGSWASMSAQSGSIFLPTQYTDTQGKIGHQSAMPQFNSTWVIALGVSAPL